MHPTPPFIIVLFALSVCGGCNRSKQYPEQLREQMRLADFLGLDESNDDVVLLFDKNKDGNPDAWIRWTKTPQFAEKSMEVDKNFDGKVDSWQYYGTHDLFAEFDKNYDGRVDEWVYKSGKKEYDTDGDGRPDRTKYIPGSQAANTNQP
ncbi:MAG: hypothetical protein WCS01_13265 [bacterium]